VTPDTELCRAVGLQFGLQILRRPCPLEAAKRTSIRANDKSAFDP
jgi:hypothetical protein